MKELHPIENILQDILSIEKCLEDYYFLVVKNDCNFSQKLTEAEVICKDEIVKDLQNLVKRVSIDVKLFKQTTCDNIQQKIEIDQNLVDLTREVKYTLLRLQRFGQLDEDLQNIFLQLKNEIAVFKTVLQQYIENSTLKVKTWKKLRKKLRKKLLKKRMI